MGVQVVTLDVNEALLDLSALDSRFETLFSDTSLRGAQWFAQMLQFGSVAGLAGNYVVTAAQHAALSMLADRHGMQLTSGDAESIVAAVSSLPPQRRSPRTATPECSAGTGGGAHELAAS